MSFDVVERQGSWVVGPIPTDLRGRFRELVEYSPFLVLFARDAARRRWRRTRLGWPWLVVRPLVGALAGTVLFSNLLGVDAGPLPYLLFYAAGLAAWTLLDVGLLWCTRSLEINRRLLQNVYFPRIFLPVTHIYPALIEFSVYLAVLLGMIGYYVAVYGSSAHPSLSSLPFLVLAVLYAVTLVIGLGLWTSVLGAHNRDLRFSLRYVTQLWMLGTPIIYPLELVPQRWRILVEANPATALVVMFRKGVLGVGELSMLMVLSATVVLTVTVASGLWFFHRAPVTSLNRV